MTFQVTVIRVQGVTFAVVIEKKRGIDSIIKAIEVITTLQLVIPLVLVPPLKSAGIPACS